MKITMWKRRIKTGSILEVHELKLDTYNEFYLPSVNLDEELWIQVDAEGTQTRLHLKR